MSACPRQWIALWHCALLCLSLLLSGPSSGQESLTYKVLERMPQSRANFVQGLQIIDNQLYVSSGGYGRSQLLRYRLPEVELELARPLDPRLFAEGLAVVGDEVFQLTWRARMVLVYHREALTPKRWFRIPGEGWGLTWNGSELIYSDGSDRLHFMDPEDGRILRSVQVTAGGRPVNRLNELEWIDGSVWANVWQSDTIVVVDPASGAVTSQLDLTGLLPDSERRPDTDVLNGIARDPASGAIWVTGKRWPWIYRIEALPTAASDE